MSQSFLTTDGLMRHLCYSNININSIQKQHLINYGYFHGYKGYRFFGNDSNRLAITKYKEVEAIIEYDNKLKELFYSKIMFIETALKNISLNIILE